MWTPDWTTLYNRDFSTLDDADVLPGGDGDVMIDGKTWYARNVSKMDALDVGSSYGGVRIGIPAASAAGQYHEGTFTGPGLELRLSSFLAGTDFEHRNDIEFRITSDVRPEGAPGGTLTEYWAAMMRSPTFDGSLRATALRGGDHVSAERFRVYSFVPVAPFYGDTWLDHTELAYFPNVLRFSYLEHFLKFEYSETSTSSIGDDLLDAHCGERTSQAQKLRFKAGDAKEAMFAIGYSKPSGGTGVVSGLILRALRIEARLSPAGIGAFVP